MLDALMYAVRDRIRSAGFNYGVAECEIMDDGKPPPSCGSYFASVHGGKDHNTSTRNLDETYDFCVTLTCRIVVPLYRVGDQQIHRNAIRIPLGERQGFRAKVEQLRRLLHMNWAMTCLIGQSPPSANDNIIAWAASEVYGFTTPAMYKGAETARLVGGEWFSADPEAEDFGVVSELRFEGARRMQPQTESVGVFV